MTLRNHKYAVFIHAQTTKVFQDFSRGVFDIIYKDKLNLKPMHMNAACCTTLFGLEINQLVNFVWNPCSRYTPFHPIRKVIGLNKKKDPSLSHTARKMAAQLITGIGSMWCLEKLQSKTLSSVQVQSVQRSSLWRTLCNRINKHINFTMRTNPFTGPVWRNAACLSANTNHCSFMNFVIYTRKRISVMHVLGLTALLTWA